MKIIFSRKGFDSTAGGFPSLIFPDGKLFSIPIPSSKDKVLYQELDFYYESDSIQDILNDLTAERIHSGKWRKCDYSSGKQYCHYDPMPFREENYNGVALGQVKSAEGHLRKQGVGKNDVFLFYGWFKKVEKYNGMWRYIENARDVHLIWSYMEVEDCINLDTQEQQDEALKKYPFLINHPHIGEQGKMKNRIYISEKSAHFSHNENRCLTDLKYYRGRATWRLPACMHQPQAFSYLNDFILDDDEVVVSYRGYGQEFVLNLDKVKSDKDRGSIKSYINELIS